MNKLATNRTLLITLATVLLCGTALAQAGQQERRGFHGPPGAEQRLAMLNERLDLSDEQSVQILQVLQEAETEREALQQRIMEQMKPEMCAQMVATEEEIRAALTEDQAERFEQLRESRGSRPGRGRDRAAPDCSEYRAD